MPSRIAYWLSSFEPDMEAVASEVAVLRRSFPQSVAWGLSTKHWILLSRHRGICLHPNLHIPFRIATRMCEPAFRLNHIFGSLGDWFYLQGQRARPTILTVATHAAPVDIDLLQRVDRFVVEDFVTEAKVRDLGISADRIRLILPPVDLERFTPRPRPDGPFTVLFASSPDSAEWLEGRGVKLLLDVAERLPNVRFRLSWRPWGNSLSQLMQWIQERQLQNNVEVVLGRESDMSQQYQKCHATIAPFVDPTRCKPAPNSLVESLACGRPVIATPVVGLANWFQDAGVGQLAQPTTASIAAAIEALAADWAGYSQRARQIAEAHLSKTRFVESYRSLYSELLGVSTCSPLAINTAH